MRKKWIILLVFVLALGFTLIRAQREKQVMAIEFSNTDLQRIDYGRLSGLPEMQGLDQKTIVILFSMDDYGTSDLQYLGGVFDDGTDGTDEERWSVVINRNSAIDGEIAFTEGFGSAEGEWRTSSGIISDDGSLHTLVITYDRTSTGNDPTIYVNSTSPLSLSEFNTPSGSALVDTNGTLHIGGTNARGGFDRRSHDGVTYAFMVFDRIISDGEIASIMNGNIPMYAPGLKFRVLGLGAQGLQSLDAATLASGNKIIDQINGYEGTPNGSPLGYADDKLNLP